MAYCQEIRKLENNIKGLEYGHILRDRNETVDELAKLRSSRGAIPPGVFLHRLDQPSTKKEIARLLGGAELEATDSLQPSSAQSAPSEVMVISSDWRTPFVNYLQTGVLPKDKDEHNRLRRRAMRYTLVGDALY